MSKPVETIASEQELLNTFRPRDRKHVILPSGMRFPLPLGHYVAWTEPSGVWVYLVFKRPEWQSAFGVAFRRDQTGSAGAPAGLCDWCHSQGPSDQIGLLTAEVTAKKRVGVNLCLDLSCIQKLESVADVTGQNLDRMATKLQERMVRFCKEALQVWET